MHSWPHKILAIGTHCSNHRLVLWVIETRIWTQNVGWKATSMRDFNCLPMSHKQARKERTICSPLLPQDCASLCACVSSFPHPWRPPKPRGNAVGVCMSGAGVKALVTRHDKLTNPAACFAAPRGIGGSRIGHFHRIKHHKKLINTGTLLSTVTGLVYQPTFQLCI